MRVRLVLFMLGATLLAVPASASAAKLSLKGSRIVISKTPAKLSGRLASGKAGRTVVIKADKFPYGTQKTVARTQTRRNGRFSARVRPALNTKYQAVLKQGSGTRSRVVRVAVSPRAHSTCNRYCDAPNTAGNFTLRITTTFTFPNKSSARSNAKKRFFFYYSSRNGRQPPARLKLRKQIDAKYLGGRKVRARVRYTYHRPRSAYVSSLNGCIKDSPNKDGIGLSGNHHCGDKSISHDIGYLGRPSLARAGAGRP